MNDPVDESNLSADGRRSRRHPGIKNAVSALPEFKQWIEGLAEVTVDDIKYYIRGGDMLKDADEVVWEWTRRHRPDLIPPEEE